MYKHIVRSPAVRGALIGLIALACAAACSSSGTKSSSGNAGTPSGSSSLHAMLPAAIQSSGVVHVASTFGYPPAEFYDASNKATGISVDVADAVGKELGVKFEFANIDFNSIIPGILANRYDTAIAAMSVTPSRLQQLDMVAYQKTGAALMVAGGNPEHLSDLASVCGKKVAILKGSIYQQALDTASKQDCTPAGKPAINVETYEQGADSYTAVAAGRADATYIDFSVAKYTAQISNGKLQVLPTLYPDIPYGAAFAPQDAALAKAFAAGLNAAIADGSYQKVLDKWGIGSLAITNATVQSGS